MTATPAQLEALERARQAKKDKATSPKVKDTVTENTDKRVWGDAFFTAMRNREVKSSSDLELCVPIADKAVEIFDREGKL